MLDPNAFIVTEFDPFNNRIEKASPYPFIVSSSDAVDYKYKNNVLQYLIVLERPTVIFKDREEVINKYTVYQDNYTIVFTQSLEENILFNPIDPLNQSIFSPYYQTRDKIPYVVSFFSQMGRL
jgi:hypothetical protein